MRKFLALIIFSIFLNAQKWLKNSDTKYIYMEIERVKLPHQNILAKIIYKGIDRVFIKVVNSSNTKVIRDMNISLSSTNDYKKHSTEVSLGSYDLGEYVFVFSADKTFQKGLSYKAITISNLAYFYKNSELLVVNRKSGFPIKGAKVIFYKENRKSVVATIKSDKNGIVKIPKNLDKYYIQIEYKNDRLRVSDTLHHIKVEKKRHKFIEKIYFFTDKDIYKPNDNIKFKAVLVTKNQKGEPTVIADRKIVIKIVGDGKKIEDKILKSDKFGAIFGSFHIPKDIVGDIRLSSKLGNKMITIQRLDKNSTKIIKTDCIKSTKGEKKPLHPKYLSHKLDKKSYIVGSTAILSIKSHKPHTKVLFNLIRNNKILKEEWIDINGSTKKLIPITKEDRGDIFYSLIMMRDNKKYIDYGVIKVPWVSELKIEYINFRDKLKPNTKEQWKIKVTDKKGIKVDAQMITNIYQSSHSLSIESLYPQNYIGKYTMWDFYPVKNSSRCSYKSNIRNSMFFNPNLQTDKNGNIIIDFKINKSLKDLKFLGFIHTKDLKTVIIQKKLIVESNSSKSIHHKKNNKAQISNQKIITKNRVLYIKPKEKKRFLLQELRDINLMQKRYKFTIEFTSNPSWFALQGMPYILEYPEKSSEEIFNKYFVNTIAYKLILISPQIEKIFKEWGDEKDKKVAQIFNTEELKEKRKLYYSRLEKLQNSDGGWSLSDDNKSNWQTTQYIVKGFTKLKEIGIDKTNTKILSQAIKFIDKQVSNEYQKLKDNNSTLQQDNLNSMIIDYLYIRTFYNFPILSKEAYRYYLNQTKKYWSNKALYEQATIALTLNKKLAKEDSIKILKSIKNNDMIYSQFPIETYTQIIKLFDTLSKDKKIAELMKVWLLKNRQNNHWDTTKSTIDAIYTLLRDNAWVINNSKLVDIQFPNSKIDYKSIVEEAKTHTQKGIGYFQVSFDKFDKSMAIVEINNPNNNSVWGVFSLQYFK